MGPIDGYPLLRQASSFIVYAVYISISMYTSITYIYVYRV